MVDLLIQFFDDVLQFFFDAVDFINRIWDWFNQGIYDFLSEWFQAFVIWLQVVFVKIQNFLLGFVWDFVEPLLSELNLTDSLSSAWSNLDSDLLNAITFFHLPEAIGIILSARVTRFLLNFIGL